MKWCGNIGFAETVETRPGVWSEQITTRKYQGTILQNSRMLQDTKTQVNSDIDISNRISIIADPYAKQNFHAIRYLEFMGTKWYVKNINVQYPRLILTLGGVYNG